MSHTTVAIAPGVQSVPIRPWDYPIVTENADDYPKGLHHYDAYFGGKGSIRGVTKKQGLVASLTVVLFERTSMLPLRRTISGTDGSYAFQNLNEALKYLVVCRETGVPEVDAQAHDYVETT